jgi:cytochrome bd-type quinol oxidase subunit 2
MDRESWFGLGVLAVVLVFQAWVTVRLRRTPIFDRPEKYAQTKLIWLVPVIGAAIVFAVLRSEEQQERRDPPGQSS